MSRSPTKGPEWGSALRTVAADYGQDPAVTAAAEAAGIKLRTWDLPIKTCMWVSPGRVTVTEGYCAEADVVWAAP